MDECKYIAFQGAGLKMVAYLGFLEALCDHFHKRYGVTWEEHAHKNIKGACGASAGAPTALAVCLNIPPSKLRHVLQPIMHNVKVIMAHMDVGELWHNYGLERGDAMREMISNLLREGGLSSTITFECMHKLTGKEFACTGTNLNRQCPVVFDRHQTPRMRVADALFISMCVPIMFAPVKYDDEYYVDGALSCNTPNVFPIEDTLVCGIETARNGSIEKWQDFLSSVLSIGLAAQHPYEEGLVRECALYVRIIQSNALLSIEPMDLTMDASTTAQLRACGQLSGLCTIFPTMKQCIVCLLYVITKLHETFLAYDDSFEGDPDK